MWTESSSVIFVNLVNISDTFPRYEIFPRDLILFGVPCIYSDVQRCIVVVVTALETK